ncbi:MAG: hypothetical protein QM499_00955 [Flavobacteriaceae bacterium]
MSRKILIEPKKITTWDSATPTLKLIDSYSDGVSIKYDPVNKLISFITNYKKSTVFYINDFTELDNVYGTTDLEGFVNHIIDNNFFKSASGGSDAFVTLDTDQEITGVKTFTKLLTAQGYKTPENDPNKALFSDGSVGKVKGKFQEVASVTGNYAIDYDTDDEDLTLTGATTFTESNIPTATQSVVATRYVTGNFGLTFPATWTTIIGTYDGTVLNQIVIHRKGNGTAWVTITQE